jgi:hypothetical protein
MNRTGANRVLRAALAIAGCAIIYLGLDIALGGIRTLGWQGSTDFLTVTDETAFAVHDSHVRFIGGVWLAVGLLMVAGAFALERLRDVLIALTAMIFVGGLARLAGWDVATLTSGAVAPSLVLELVFFPLLGFWIAKAVPAPNARDGTFPRP